MSYNGSGTFQINTTGQPVVTGTVISSTAFNALTADLATGLSTAITKDGQTATTARIPFAAGISSTLVTDSSSTSTGSIITAGGIGVAKALYVGTTANIAGASTFTGAIAVDSVTDSSSTTTGSIQTDGGLGVAKAVFIGTTLNVASTTTLTGVATLTANPVLSAGTANGVTYLNGSKSLTSGAAITFDGTNFATTGTATAAKLIPTGSSVTGNGLYLPAANALGLSTNGTNAVYIDASQNVGIGTSSPSYKLNVVSTSSSGVSTGVFSNANNSLFIRNGGGTIVYVTSDSSVNNAWGMDSTSNYVAAYTGTGAERMRITSGGYVLVGTTTIPSPNGILGLKNPSHATIWGSGPDTNGTYLVYNSSSVGVYLGSGNTAWSSSSDERIKTAITPFENALEKVCTLRAGTGRYLKDEETVSRSFLIAQDVQAVLPEAVNVQNDEIGTLGLQYTDVIPLLVAAIQEQQALITALTARITALEAK